jgi:hypothetical protein
VLDLLTVMNPPKTHATTGNCYTKRSVLTRQTNTPRPPTASHELPIEILLYPLKIYERASAKKILLTMTSNVIPVAFSQGVLARHISNDTRGIEIPESATPAPEDETTISFQVARSYILEADQSSHEKLTPSLVYSHGAEHGTVRPRRA